MLAKALSKEHVLDDLIPAYCPYMCASNLLFLSSPRHMCDLTVLGITLEFFVQFTCSQMNVPRTFSFPLIICVSRSICHIVFNSSHSIIFSVLTNYIFLTVCDELFLGIPHKAWWVVVLVLLCLGLAFIIPSFLPSYLLQKSQSPRSVNHNVSKVS